jgi:hypothetical protein
MSKIGNAYWLKVDCLGNKAGSIGYVYEEYQDFDDPFCTGVSIIFENGEHDGFSKQEQDDLLNFYKNFPKYSDYKFQSVLKVWSNYLEGYWKWFE